METVREVDEACREVVENVDGAIACGVIDLGTGMLLGNHVVAGHGWELGQALVTMAMRLFRGPTVGRIEQVLRSRAGELDGECGESFEEVHVTANELEHFGKVIHGGKVALLLVTRKTTNQGLGWARVKAAVPRVEPYLS